MSDAELIAEARHQAKRPDVPIGAGMALIDLADRLESANAELEKVKAVAVKYGFLRDDPNEKPLALYLQIGFEELQDSIAEANENLTRLRAVEETLAKVLVIPDSVRDLIVVAVKRCLTGVGGKETDAILKWNDVINAALSPEATNG